MKRTIAFILIILFVILVGCGRTHKEDVFKIVEANYAKILTACENKDVEALLSVNGVTQVKIAEGYVVVFCKGTGIAPSSQDYGFYYSENNVPATVDCNLEIVCTADALTSEGKGLKCVISGNEFYTENIKGDIYFYSNAY